MKAYVAPTAFLPVNPASLLAKTSHTRSIPSPEELPSRNLPTFFTWIPPYIPTPSPFAQSVGSKIPNLRVISSLLGAGVGIVWA